MKIVILKNEIIHSERLWIQACKDFDLPFDVIDLTKDSWLEELQLLNPDLLLVMPSGFTSQFKQMFDERLFLIHDCLKIRMFPSLDEIRLHENKRYFYSWLKVNDLPMAQTNIFYNQAEIEGFISKCSFPIVAKTNMGASGSGVKILRNQEELLSYCTKAFSSKGISKKVGPKSLRINPLKRILKVFRNPSHIKNRLKIYNSLSQDPQVGFVIFQEYIPHDFEWRIVRIGDSFFAHKKMKSNELSSGTLLKNYDNPPLELFDFAKELTDRFSFQSMAIDCFERNGKFVINEMQCIFGQSDSFQMKVDNRIGRYVNVENSWKFEEGDFNQNQCFNLRLKTALELYQSGNLR
ncbi:MAG: hypothetical protein RLZ10_2661 [Bacteroidota bacterium]